MHYSERKWKLSHDRHYVFDYNSKLELDYQRYRKLNTVQEDEDEAEEKKSLQNTLSTDTADDQERSTVFRVSSLRDINMETIKSYASLPSLIQSVLRPESLATRTPSPQTIATPKSPISRTLSGQSLPPALNPLSTCQYLKPTRRTLVLEGQSGKRECTVADTKDGDIKFSCIPRQDGVVCRSYKSLLDIVTVGREGNFVGIYRSIDGFKDGLVARIKKGPFGKVKYQVDLITQAEKTKIITSIAKEPIRRTAFVTAAGPDVRESLLVSKKKAGTFKIINKTTKRPIATIKKDTSSKKAVRYWLHLEPNVDSCFASITAIFALRKKLFGDNIPGILKTQHNFFSQGESKVKPV